MSYDSIGATGYSGDRRTAMYRVHQRQLLYELFSEGYDYADVLVLAESAANDLKNHDEVQTNLGLTMLDAAGVWFDDKSAGRNLKSTPSLQF